jgi:putative intracellular protease/amidase
MEKILIVASAADHIELAGNKCEPSGYYLNELVIPAWRFIEAGFDVVVATPGAKRPVMDARSDKAAHFGNDPQKLQAAQNFVENHPAMQTPLSLKEAAGHPENYAAVFIPGGHAPMTDLMCDRDLGRILRESHRAGKPTGALCHGPVALLAALPNASAYRKALVAGGREAAKSFAGDWPYAGYRMTVFSTKEEKIVEQNVFKAKMPFYVADALAEAGAKVQNAAEFKPLVIEDRELVTGQNPASAEGLAQAMLKMLAGRSSRAVA